MSKSVFQSNPPFLEVRCSEPVPFYFARRRGKDSIAVFLYRYNRFEVNEGEYEAQAEILLRHQPLVHLEDGDSKEVFPCPVTGSLELGEDPELCTLREIEEETGYIVLANELQKLGSYIVGTKTDEVVHFYTAEISEDCERQKLTATGDGGFPGAISHNEWVDAEKFTKNLVKAEEPVYAGLIIGLFWLVTKGVIQR
jgi:8-oxo-dGTP diphosphatase